MSNPILTSEDLDDASCQDPECAEPECKDGELPILIAPACHEGVPTWASYHKGVLSIYCAQCNEPVTHVYVASGHER